MTKAGKYPCDIFRVAGQCGVRLLDPTHHRPGKRRPRDCFAKKTCKKIGQHFGEAHLALVLRLIVETEGNASELYRETLQAVSAVLASDPTIIERGSKLFDAFDAIDLAAIRQKAKALNIDLPVTQVMRVMIALEMQPAGDRRQMELFA